jgi:glycosyltransferase involved in cell wall biosynthesis
VGEVRTLVAVVEDGGVPESVRQRAVAALQRSIDLAVADPECSLQAGTIVEAAEGFAADAGLTVEASGYCAPDTVARLVDALADPSVGAADARHLPTEGTDLVDYRSGEQPAVDPACAVERATGTRNVQARGAVFARAVVFDTEATAYLLDPDATCVAEWTGIPAVTVVIRTQGRRPATLTEVLCGLAVQTDQRFEVVIVVHAEDPAPVQVLVDSFEPGLRDRVRVLGCAAGERGVPANAGLRAAWGEYVVFLDDDDAVAADWIATITEGMQQAPGQVIRWWAAAQPRIWGDASEVAAHRPTGPLVPRYTDRFSMVTHLWGNQTPIHTFAFPRDVVDEGFAFDETLPVVEDWQFLMRVAFRRGVHDMERITCVYHLWEKTSSIESMPWAEWDAIKDRVREEWDAAPLVLPPGSVADIVAVHRRADEQERELTKLRKQVTKLQARVADSKSDAREPDPPAIASVRRAVGRLKGNLRRD